MTEQNFQIVSDRLSRAFETGNSALYRSLMALPLYIGPKVGDGYTIHTEEELDADFGIYRDAIRAAGVTDIQREVISSQPVPQGHRVRYKVTLYVKGEVIADPHQTEILLVRTPTGPKVAEMISNSDFVDWSAHGGAQDGASRGN